MSEATHFQCRCGDLFPREDALVTPCTEPREFWGESCLQHGSIASCTNCGSDELEDAWMCPTCGIRPISEGLDECEPCFAANEGYQDARVERIKELQLAMELQEEMNA